MKSSVSSSALNDWIETTATVVSCRARWQNLIGFGYRIPFGMSDSPGYVVTFFYEADGRTFDGKFQATIPYDAGHTFKISYDPDDPKKNTGADYSSWFMHIIAIGAGILVWIAIEHWRR
jgi:Protein of unknown function (DUF3592)